MRRHVPGWISLAMLAAALGVLAWRDAALSGLLLAGYVLMSAVTYVAYWADKSAARAGRFRTEESALHLLEVAGGWPGALFAQRRFRHKTRKASYQIAFWVCVAANIGVLADIAFLNG